MSLTEIKMIRPVFRCRTDEDVFHQRISEIAGIQNIEMSDSTIVLSILSQFNDDALNDVESICDMWHTTYKV